MWLECDLRLQPIKKPFKLILELPINEPKITYKGIVADKVLAEHFSKKPNW